MITANVGDKVRLTGYGVLHVRNNIGRVATEEESVGVVEEVFRYHAVVRLPIEAPRYEDGLWRLEDDEFVVVKEEDAHAG
jgi:hypothetical protein